MTSVARGILGTLAYFDQFEYPLTREELWRWWYGPGEPAPDRAAFDSELASLLASGRVNAAGDFFILSGRQAIVTTRAARLDSNRLKWQRAERAARAAQSVPFVRFFGVCNTVAINNGRPESDVDVFIVVRGNRLWLTRFLVTAIVSLLGIRRTGKKIADRVCLSFFVTDRALDFSPLLLKPSDPYFAFWVDQLVPLYDPDNLLGEIRRQNLWVRRLLPNAFVVTPRPRIFSYRAATVKRFWELFLGGFIGTALESAERTLQQGRMRLTARTSPTRKVVISDDVLKFHEEDRREQYNQRFRDRLAGVLGE